MDAITYEIIEESPVSTVYRARPSGQGADSPAGLQAVKISTANPEFAKEPHDIRKEIRLLSKLSHPNIVTFLRQDMDDMSHRLWMPYIPHSLKNLLANESFAPTPYGATFTFEEERRFSILAKSIIYQLLQALQYLHHPSRSIAHRDIKPGNILLTAECQVKLIDFGISWETQPNEMDDFWPESSENMYTEVSTGPYRAPELLFGPKSYDAFATDVWSLGATFAEFFTPLRLASDDEGTFSDEENDELCAAFVIPRSLNPGSDSYWERISLFDAERGDIGLAWSIFKVRGTPNEEIWPRFSDLPHSGRVTFITAPPVDLQHLLPNLPSTSSSRKIDLRSHFPPKKADSSPLDLITRMLVYPPDQRLRPDAALKHPWFSTSEVPLVLTDDSPAGDDMHREYSWEGHLLGYWLRHFLSGSYD